MICLALNVDMSDFERLMKKWYTKLFEIVKSKYNLSNTEFDCMCACRHDKCYFFRWSVETSNLLYLIARRTNSRRESENQLFRQNWGEWYLKLILQNFMYVHICTSIDSIFLPVNFPIVLFVLSQFITEAVLIN